MCEDFLRAGYQKFIVDPGVRQAYFPETARKLYTDKVSYIGTTLGRCMQCYTSMCPSSS